LPDPAVQLADDGDFLLLVAVQSPEVLVELGDRGGVIDAEHGGDESGNGEESEDHLSFFASRIGVGRWHRVQGELFYICTGDANHPLEDLVDLLHPGRVGLVEGGLPQVVADAAERNEVQVQGHVDGRVGPDVGAALLEDDVIGWGVGRGRLKCSTGEVEARADLGRK